MPASDESALSPDDGEVTIVLAAIDTSMLAGRVIELAARLARRAWSPSELHVLHVFRSARFDRPTSAGINRQERVEEARSYLEYHIRSARRQNPTHVTGHFAEGDPGEQILKTARALRADLLVVGTHDKAGLERMLLGSVASRLARSAPCSVLVVRAKERPYTKIS